MLNEPSDTQEIPKVYQYPERTVVWIGESRTAREVVQLWKENRFASGYEQTWLNRFVTPSLVNSEERKCQYVKFISAAEAFGCFVIKGGGGSWIDIPSKFGQKAIDKLKANCQGEFIKVQEVPNWRLVWAPKDTIPLGYRIPHGTILFPDPRAPDHLWRGMIGFEGEYYIDFSHNKIGLGLMVCEQDAASYAEACARFNIEQDL